MASSYSLRRQATGSTRDARRAGIQAAPSATARSSAGAPTNVTGSTVESPNSRLDVSRASARPSGEAEAQPDRDEPHALGERQAHDLAAARADRDPHAELARALRDRLRDDAREPQGREAEPHRAEREQHRPGDPRRQRREADEVRERARRRHGHERVDVLHRLAHGRGPRERVAARRPHQHRRGHELPHRPHETVVLRERDVEERPRVLAERPVLRVARDADDLEERALGAARAQPAADRVLPGPVAARERLVDDRDAAACRGGPRP